MTASPRKRKPRETAPAPTPHAPVIAPQAQQGEQGEDRALRPKSLADYVGQQALRDQLTIFLKAAAHRGEALDHVLLFGPPGLGKTTLAQIIAAELPFESVLAAGLLSLVAFGLPWLVVVGLIGFLAGHLAARYRELAGVAEEIRADWFALQTSCSAEEFVSALREASVVGRRPWSRAVYLRARLARHNERRSGGKLVFFSGSMMWLPGVEKVTAPSTRALWQRVARGVASE